mmetsp:Transcript_114521/g.370043  ORF Transcript_114521/g.370043 Transcript_114521/m.370043 type:complete len:185 (-) Transcript_114521:75-629(-)
MQLTTAAAALALLSLPGLEGFSLRSGRAAQEPDTTCGKGFDSLNQGSKDYFATAAVELWKHPYHRMDNATFEDEFECWFASMMTVKCGNLPSRADERKDELTKKCEAPDVHWFKVWNMFTKDEQAWFKKSYPSEEVQGEGESTVHYKQVMETAKEVNKKEVLCLTLFTIDDECVKFKYIRMGGK